MSNRRKTPKRYSIDIPITISKRFLPYQIKRALIKVLTQRAKNNPNLRALKNNRNSSLLARRILKKLKSIINHWFQVAILTRSRLKTKIIVNHHHPITVQVKIGK